MTQQDINEEILHILTCLIHSDDNYKRECVDLNANAFLDRLRVMMLPTKQRESASSATTSSEFSVNPEKVEENRK